MGDLDTTRIEQLYAATSKDTVYGWCYGYGTLSTGDDKEWLVNSPSDYQSTEQDKANGMFMAEIHNQTPALLAEIKRLRDQRNELSLSLNLLCGSLMLFFALLDDPYSTLRITGQDPVWLSQMQLQEQQVRDILADVNPDPTFLDDPTEEQIRAVKLEPDYEERRARIAAKVKSAFDAAWEKKHG